MSLTYGIQLHNSKGIGCLTITVLQINFIKCLCNRHFLKARIKTGVTPYQANLVGHRFRDGIKSEPHQFEDCVLFGSSFTLFNALGFTVFNEIFSHCLCHDFYLLPV